MKNDKQLTQEQQVILLAQQDRKNFQPLYEKYFDQIYWFILKRIGSESLSGDICQQVFFQAMVALPKYRFQGFPFSSWLYRIALNEVNQYYRKSKKARYVEIEEEHLMDMVEEVEFDTETVDPDALVEKLLAHLNPEELSIIEMKYFEGKGFREIGEILSLKESACKVRAHRILKKLRTVLSTLGVK